MSASVGGVLCTYVKGVSTGLQQNVMNWSVPGTNGQFALDLGFNDGEFAFKLVQYDSLTNVVAWKNSIEVLLGSVVTIVDDWGQNWANCLLVNVSKLDRTPAAGAGGIITCRGELAISGRVAA